MRRILLLFIPFLYASCLAQGSAFGMKASRIEELLRSGDLSFLDEVSEDAAKEALSLGPGAAWVLGRHAWKSGREGLALAFWRAEVSGTPGPGRDEADRDLRILLRKLDDWEALSLAARARLLREPGEAQATVDALEALLALGRNAEAADLAAGSPTDASPQGQRAAALGIIARFRTGAGIEGLDGFLRSATDPNALRFLYAEFLGPLSLLRGLDQSNPPLPESSQRLVVARNLSAEKDYGAARKAWTEAGFPAAIGPLNETIVLEAGKAWLWGGGAREGTELFARLAESSPSEAAAAARLYAGRCLDAIGKKTEARLAWRAAIQAAGPGSVRDAAIWFLLDSLLAGPSAATLDAYRAFAPLWSDSAYFSDVLGRFLSDLARAKDGASLAALRTALAGRAEVEVLDRLDWLISRLGAGPGAESSGPVMVSTKPGWASPLSYFSLMTALASGSRSPAAAFSAAGEGPAVGPEPSPASLEGFLALLLRSGLSGEALSIAQRETSKATLDAEAFRRLAARASQFGAHAQAAILSAIATGKDGRVTRADLELFYPRPYADELGTAALERGIPREILFALARTESWFNPAAVSHAGAVGLCQLMPATAEGVAKKLRMAEYDLRDPATSARLGAAYLSSLVDYFDGDLLLAILAYNGGMGRIRSLRREKPNLPVDLFMESLPIAETRDYGRKVVAAAVAYAWLWGDADALARLHRALPGLEPDGEEG